MGLFKETSGPMNDREDISWPTEGPIAQPSSMPAPASGARASDVGR